MDKRAVISIVGFLLFLYGGLSLVLSLIGVQLSFMTWLDRFGLLASLLIKLGMIVFGIAMVYVSRMSDDE